MFTVSVEREADLAVVFQRAGQVAQAVGFSSMEQGLIAAAAFEAACNAIDCKRKAAIDFLLIGKPPVQRFLVHLTKDRQIEPIISEILPMDAQAMTQRDLREIKRRILSVPRTNALDELRRQNRALSQCLHKLKQVDTELDELCEQRTAARRRFRNQLGARATKPVPAAHPSVAHANGQLCAVVNLARSDWPFLDEHLELLDPLLELSNALTCLENGVLPDMLKLKMARGGRPKGGAGAAELRAHAAAAVTILVESKEVSLAQALRFVRDELAKAGIVQPNKNPITATTLRNWRTRVTGGSKTDADKQEYDFILACFRLKPIADPRPPIERAKAIEKASRGKQSSREILAELAPGSAPDDARAILGLATEPGSALRVLWKKAT